jgi:uncharacterized protein
VLRQPSDRTASQKKLESMARAWEQIAARRAALSKGVKIEARFPASGMRVMFPVIVPTYAAIFAFIYLVLSVQVIRGRRQAKAAIGTRGDVRLERKIRVHANFAEYVPFALLLLSFVEMQGGPAWLIHLICLAFLAGRAIHAYGVRQVQEDYKLRSTGKPSAGSFLVHAHANR